MLSAIGTGTTFSILRPVADRSRAPGGFGAALAGLSPQATRAPAPDFATITADYDARVRQARADGAGPDFLDRLDRQRASFLNVARKAVEGGGFDDARGFVARLSPAERETLRQVHSLGASIDPAALTDEGARNLLVPRTLACDTDGDGTTEIGIGQAIVFPPGDAPAEVKAAWVEATKDMDFVDRLHLEMNLSISRTQSDGEVEGGNAATDYRALVDRAVEGASFNLRNASADHRVFAARQIENLTRFATALGGEG